MDRVYVVGFEDDCLIAFKERADAEEYIFTIAEENLYEGCLCYAEEEKGYSGLRQGRQPHYVSGA